MEHTESNTNETARTARIRLAEAMGWTPLDLNLVGWWMPPGHTIDEHIFHIVRVDAEHLPNPFTDANDDVAVLQWARGNLDDKDYAAAMFAVVEEQGGDVGSSFPVYVKGNYARAACKVLEID